MNTACTQYAVLHTVPPTWGANPTNISPCVPCFFFSPTDVLQLYHHVHSPSKAVQFVPPTNPKLRDHGNCDRDDRSTVAVQCETIAIERPSVKRGAVAPWYSVHLRYPVLIKTLLAARSESPFSPLFIGSSRTHRRSATSNYSSSPARQYGYAICSMHEWDISCANAEA